MEHKSYLENQLKELITSSVAMMKLLDNEIPMCPSCCQLRRQLVEKDQIILELRSAMEMVECVNHLSPPITHISENHEVKFNKTFLEACHREDRLKSELDKALDKERVLLAQLAMYETDFKMEREDRADAHGQLEQVRGRLEASERERFALSNNLREANRIIEDQKIAIQTLRDEQYAVNLQYNDQRRIGFPRMRPVLVSRGFDEPDMVSPTGSSVVEKEDRTSPLPENQLLPVEPVSLRFNALDETDYILAQSATNKRTASPPRGDDFSFLLNLSESSPLSHSALHNAPVSRSSAQRQPQQQISVHPTTHRERPR